MPPKKLSATLEYANGEQFPVSPDANPFYVYVWHLIIINRE